MTSSPCTGNPAFVLLSASCKRRGFCPSCGARRMVASTATLIQRFGSALNLNPHLHMLFLDGACRFGGTKGRFHHARRATNDALAQLLCTPSRRIVRVLESLGFQERSSNKRNFQFSRKWPDPGRPTSAGDVKGS